MPSTKQNTATLRAQNAQNLKLYDCLIEVTRTGSPNAALFWLSGYLRKATGLQDDGKIKCSLLSYSQFQNDLHAHFKYDADIDEIRWENKTAGSEEVNPENGTGPCIPSFAVLSHNSWVTALLTMQLVKFSSQPQVPGARARSPFMTAATFTIVRKKDAEDDDTTDTETDTDTDSESESDSGDETKNTKNKKDLNGTASAK